MMIVIIIIEMIIIKIDTLLQIDLSIRGIEKR